jgi:hypothetical protein
MTAIMTPPAAAPGPDSALPRTRLGNDASDQWLRTACALVTAHSAETAEMTATIVTPRTSAHSKRARRSEGTFFARTTQAIGSPVCRQCSQASDDSDRLEASADHGAAVPLVPVQAAAAAIP